MECSAKRKSRRGWTPDACNTAQRQTENPEVNGNMLITALNRAIGNNTRIVGSELNIRYKAAPEADRKGGRKHTFKQKGHLIITLKSPDWTTKWKQIDEKKAIENEGAALQKEGIVVTPRHSNAKTIVVEVTGPKRLLEDAHAEIIRRELTRKARGEPAHLKKTKAYAGFTNAEFKALEEKIASKAKPDNYLKNLRAFLDYEKGQKQ